MKTKTLLIVCLVLLLLNCSQRVVDPAEEGSRSFMIIDCDKAEKFFQPQGNSLNKPSGYYACACPDKASKSGVVITVTVPEAMRVVVAIKNATGYDIRTYDFMASAGLNIVYWDEKSEAGKDVKPGMYIVTIVAFSDEARYEADLFMILQ